MAMEAWNAATVVAMDMSLITHAAMEGSGLLDSSQKSRLLIFLDHYVVRHYVYNNDIMVYSNNENQILAYKNHIRTSLINYLVFLTI